MAHSTITLQRTTKSGDTIYFEAGVNMYEGLRSLDYDTPDDPDEVEIKTLLAWKEGSDAERDVTALLKNGLLWDELEDEAHAEIFGL